MRRKVNVALLMMVGIFCVPARGEVRLHGLFSDHAVLQRERKDPVGGWADEGEEVTVEFAGQTVKGVAR